MMRWLAIVLGLLAGSVNAQQEPVRSGAHPGFTRLTVPVAPDQIWAMGRTEDGYAVRFDAPLAPDLSRVFDRIDRNRLSGIAAEGNQIALSLGCECHATAFMYRDAYLVIDIRDGPAKPASPFEVALDPEVAPTIAMADASNVSGTPRRMVLPLAPGTAPIPVATIGLRADPPRPAPQPAKTPAGRTPELMGLERDVIDSLARAASQGLLNLAPDVENESAAAIPHVEETPDHDAPQMPAEGHAAGNDHAAPDTHPAGHMSALGMPGLLAQTSLDALQAELDSARDATSGGGRCWPSQFTDLTLPEDAAPDFGTRIGALRAAVTDDRDRPDMEAVTALARGFLSFGFGEEAIQSLAIDGVTDRSRLALLAMAQVIDGLPQSRPDLAAQIGCPGSTGLWALLADGTPEAAAKADSDQIVQQFKLLPEPVQTALAARLADLLRQGGRADMAELVLAPAQRMVSPPVEVALAETELALHRGDVAAATETLADLAQDDSRMTPEALVQLVDLQLSQNTPVMPETLALLESMQFEFRGQPVVADLMRARVGAMAQAGQFGETLQLLPAAETLLQQAKADTLRSDVVRAVTAGADDMTFLDVAFRPLGREVAPDVQNAVAARLLDLGFPERASDVVSGPAIGSVMAERRYLRATAAMDMDDPETAAAQLAGVSTERAQRILGLDPATGPEAVAAGNDAAWREGDWATLASSEDSLLQEAAALVQEDVDATPDTQTPLASGRALIEDAARTRATIDTLMSRFAPPS